MRKFLSVLLVVLMFAVLFTACNKPADPETPVDVSEVAGWQYIVDKNELVVGLDATFAPMGFTDENGEIVGFDIDLANEVSKILNIPVRFQPISWDAKEMELSSKRIDCIWNGMSQTPERQEQMALTKPYLNNRIVIMGKDADKIATIEDLVGLNIGTQAKSSSLDALMAHEIYESVKDNVIEMVSYDEVILDMKTGRVDVMIVDEVLGEYKNLQLEEADKMTVSEASFGDDLYVIGCRKGETDVVEKIEGAIKTLMDNGTALALSEKWFAGQDLLVPMA